MRRSAVALLVAGLLFTACDSHKGEVDALDRQVGDLQAQVQTDHEDIAQLQKTARATEKGLRECLGEVVAASRTLATSVRYLAGSHRSIFGPSIDFYSADCRRVMDRQDLKRLKTFMFQAGRVVEDANLSTLEPIPTSNVGTTPAGATAICRDGTYSYSQHASGTCSHHHGVSQWLNYPGN
jgi:Protein of unknown function (DUF3761)